MAFGPAIAPIDQRTLSPGRAGRPTFQSTAVSPAAANNVAIGIAPNTTPQPVSQLPQGARGGFAGITVPDPNFQGAVPQLGLAGGDFLGIPGAISGRIPQDATGGGIGVQGAPTDQFAQQFPQGGQQQLPQQLPQAAPQQFPQGISQQIAQQVPQTGLIGSEQALLQGLVGGAGAIETGAQMGRADISGATQQALQQLGLAGLDIGQQIRGGQQALGGAGQRIGQQIAGGQGQLSQAGADIASQIAAGTAGLSPFISGGQQAQQQQAALSGALGAQAQAQAFADFQASPGQEFLTETAERSLLRNQAAIGGLGGGNVRQELQRQAIGLAAQDFENQFGRLGQVTGTGLTAAGQVGQLAGQQAGLTGQLGQAGAQLAGQQAGLTGTLGQAQANLFGQQAGLTSGLGQAGAQTIGQGGINLANLAQGAGLNIGQSILGTGQQVAAGRTRAGEQIAGQVGATTSSLADLVSQQGAGVSDIAGQGAINLANLISGAGQAQGASQEQLAALLANIATQQGSQITALPQVQTGGVPSALGQIGTLASGAGGLISGLSDAGLIG